MVSRVYAHLVARDVGPAQRYPRIARTLRMCRPSDMSFPYVGGATDRRRAGGDSEPRAGSTRIAGCARPVVLVQGSPQLRVEQAPDEVVSGGGQPVLHVLVAGGVPAAGGR